MLLSATKILPARPATLMAVVAVGVSVLLILGGAFVLVQVADLASDLKRLTVQLHTLEEMNAQLKTMGAQLSSMNTSLDTTNGQLTRTRVVLEKMAGSIEKMSERLQKAKLLF